MRISLLNIKIHSLCIDQDRYNTSNEKHTCIKFLSKEGTFLAVKGTQSHYHKIDELLIQVY